MRKMMLSRYERVMSGGLGMKLLVPHGYCGEDVEAWGIRKVERKNHGEMRWGRWENDSILRGKGRSVECREGVSWVSGSKVDG
jgi:hypothetical protein